MVTRKVSRGRASSSGAPNDVLVRRDSRGSSRDTAVAGVAPSSGRGGNLLSEVIIKENARTFDLEDVYKFSYVGKGLERITVVGECTNLEELDLSDNSIERIEEVGTLTLLRKLTLTANKISRVEGLDGLDNLEHLLIQGNRIHSLDDLNLPLLASLPKLKTLYLRNVDGSEGNPVCGLGPAYKNAVLAACKGLRNLDGERLPSRAREDLGAALNAGSAVVGGGGGRASRGYGGGRGGGKGGSWLEGFDWGEEGRESPEAIYERRSVKLRALLMECRELNQDAINSMHVRRRSSVAGP